MSDIISDKSQDAHYNRHVPKKFRVKLNYDSNGKEIKKAVAKKMSHSDKIAQKYGGMTSSGEYIKPDTKKFAKEQRQFNSAKKEINKLEKKEKSINRYMTSKGYNGRNRI